MKQQNKPFNLKGLSIGIILITAVTILCVSLYKTQTLSAAFYNVDAATASEIGRQLSSNHIGRIVIKTLDGTAPVPKSVHKKYHLLFAWNGMPNMTLNNFDAEKIPILTDSFCLAFNKKKMNNKVFYVPTTLAQLEEYLSIIKQTEKTPLFCAGGDDKDFSAFISALTDSMGGADAYEALKSEIENGTPFETLLDISLNGKETDEDIFTLRTVLDKIKFWQDNGLLNSDWLTQTATDRKNYIEKKQTAVVFMSLSEQRILDEKFFAATYETKSFMPDIPGAHALIAPQLCAIVFNKTAGEEKALARILSQNAQERLSKISKLAPVNTDAHAYDEAADDVRFQALSCAAGALPPLTMTENTAQKMKEYLK